jgi:3-oxoacyl-[acyl-carrier protein] reductase
MERGGLMDLDLGGKRVFVGGASRGIGLAIAQAFAAEGAKVAIAARGRADLDAASRNLKGGLAIESDLTDEKAAVQAVDRAEAELGPLDVVVANVGSGISTVASPVPRSEWQRMMDVNFFGASSIGTHAAHLMAGRKGGALVFISSIAGLEAVGAPAAYAAAKAALQAMVKSLAREYGQKNVRVNAVAPGNVVFPGGSWDQRRREAPDKVEQALKDVPLGRLGEPREIADVVLFLASGRASFVTGATWVVDGGQTRRID